MRLVLILLLLSAAFIGVALILADRAKTSARALLAERNELRALVARVDQIAFQHREIDPRVAPLIIDEIRAYRDKTTDDFNKEIRHP